MKQFNLHGKTIKETVNMTEGNILGLLVSFAAPIFISQIFQQLYNTADTLIVGNFLGGNSMSAVSASGNLIFFVNSFFLGLANGAGIVVAKYFGAGDEDSVSKAVHTNIAFGIVAGVLLTIIGVVFTPHILVLMKTDPAILPEATEYFRFYFAGIIMTVMYNVLSGILNAVGDSRRPLIYLITSSLTNIALDAVFVGAFGWGVWSAAVATVISQFVSVILCFTHLLKPGNCFSVEIKKIRFDKKILFQIFKLGIPTGIQNSVISIANIIVQTSINSFGAMATGAFGAYSKIEGFVFIPINSFGMATSTFISQNLGARKYDRAKKGSVYGTLIPTACGALFGLLVYFTISTLISWFSDDPEITHYAVTQARIDALFYFLLAFSHAVAHVCRGAGKAVVPMVIMLSVWCVFRISYIVTMMHFFGKIELVYWAYPITWSISAVIYLFYFLYSDWVHGLDKTM